MKGGDYRSRESNVYRLAEVSADIIDQCVAQGVPFAREYGGLLDNRSVGGAQVSRTFYARGCNVTATWRAHRCGAWFANPCYAQVHPTCIPVSGEHQSKLTLMSEPLRNDGRVWVAERAGDPRPPDEVPEDERD